MALEQNPNPNSNTSNLNAHATPYTKLTLHFSPPPFVLSYSPQYVYHYHYPLEMLYYNTQKQLFPVKPIHTQGLRDKTQCYTAPEKPKRLRPFFPRYDVVDKDVGAEDKEEVTVKDRSGRTFYAPRLGFRRSLLLMRKDERQKSRVAKKGLEKKVTSDRYVSERGNIVTSLMIRNIPNKFQRNDLLEILDNYCLEQNRVAKFQGNLSKSKYDFLYLPMDFKTGGNLGYAFVNFTSPIAAGRFRDAFQHYKWELPNNKKICQVSNAVIQGRDALRNHFKNSAFPCHTNEYLPVVFSPPRHGSNCPRFDLVGRRVNVSSALTK